MASSGESLPHPASKPEPPPNSDSSSSSPAETERVDQTVRSLRWAVARNPFLPQSSSEDVRGSGAPDPAPTFHSHPRRDPGWLRLLKAFFNWVFLPEKNTELERVIQPHKFVFDVLSREEEASVAKVPFAYVTVSEQRSERSGRPAVVFIRRGGLEVIPTYRRRLSRLWGPQVFQFLQDNIEDVVLGFVLGPILLPFNRLLGPIGLVADVVVSEAIASRIRPSIRSLLGDSALGIRMAAWEHRRQARADQRDRQEVRWILGVASRKSERVSRLLVPFRTPRSIPWTDLVEAEFSAVKDMAPCWLLAAEPLDGQSERLRLVVAPEVGNPHLGFADLRLAAETRSLDALTRDAGTGELSSPVAKQKADDARTRLAEELPLFRVIPGMDGFIDGLLGSTT